MQIIPSISRSATDPIFPEGVYGQNRQMAKEYGSKRPQNPQYLPEADSEENPAYIDPDGGGGRAADKPGEELPGKRNIKEKEAFGEKASKNDRNMIYRNRLYEDVLL